jgi:hypothetical protein
MNTERDEQLIASRPILPIEVAGSNETESFQHLTLRPVLKLQNDLIGLRFRRHMDERRVKRESLSPEAFGRFIEQELKSSHRLKDNLIGMITGLMTLEEYQFYLQNQTEINKRIVAMLIRRIGDQMGT